MKNIIISAVVGLLFMGGGFFYGLKLKPLPTPQPAAAAPVVAKSTSILPPPGTPITISTLEKATETMMSLNDALKVREQKVTEREAQAEQREDELAAERKALDNSHDKFKQLYGEFQSRLNLVEAAQVAQLQKQAELYDAMGTEQSIDIIRAMDDDAMVRLFSVMDTKPLAKLVSQWKTKYPQDAPRLLHNLDGMAQVMPKEKIALSDTPASTDASTPSPTAPDPSAPDPSAPAPAVNTDNSTPAPAATPTDPAAPPAAAPATPADGTATPATPATPATNDATPTATPLPPDGTTPSAAPPAAQPALNPPSDSTSTPTSTATN